MTSNRKTYDTDDVDFDDFDVVIIGGGLTGLTAAYKIMKKNANLSLAIIENQGVI